MARRIVIPTLVLSAVVALAIGSFRGSEGQAFGGSSFDGETPQEALKVFGDLGTHLLAHGFTQDGNPPSPWGTHSDGAREVSFMGATEETRNVVVQLSFEGTSVHSSICWEKDGFRWQIHQARLRAFQAAAEIDDCISHRQEKNLVPERFAAAQRKKFRDELARNSP